MTFEGVIVYQREEGIRIHTILLERLREVLTDNLNEFDDDATARMLLLNFERSAEPVTDEASVTRRRTVLGFTLELPDETASARMVIDEFADALLAVPVEHVVKFEDPLLRQELAQRAEELFALEMKLRRVLSVIYLQAYRDKPYDLLRDETTKPMNPPQEAQMQAAAENEFFFLTFSQYVGLNQRPGVRQLPALVELIRSNDTYEALRRELERQPVEDEDDAVFLAGLRARMNAIEAMRNCVAHNRRPAPTVTENYLNTRPQVEDALDQFLARWALVWQDEIDDGEMP